MGTVRKGRGRARKPALTDSEYDVVISEAAKQIGEWLMERKLDRPIYSLSMDELKGIAGAAIAGFIHARAELAAQQKWQSDDADVLLSG